MPTDREGVPETSPSKIQDFAGSMPEFMKEAELDFIHETYAKHPTKINNYQGSLKDLARDLGNLRYDRLQVFFLLLENKILEDARVDDQHGRKQLASLLNKLSIDVNKVSMTLNEIWGLCKSKMTDRNIIVDTISMLEEITDETDDTTMYWKIGQACGIYHKLDYRDDLFKVISGHIYKPNLDENERSSKCREEIVKIIQQLKEEI